MKFKIRGATKIETIENVSFVLMGLGILLVIVGFSLSVGSSNTVAGTAAISGSFLFFVFLVVLVLTLFVKEIRSPENKSESSS